MIAAITRIAVADVKHQKARAALLVASLRTARRSSLVNFGLITRLASRSAVSATWAAHAWVTDARIQKAESMMIWCGDAVDPPCTVPKLGSALVAWVSSIESVRSLVLVDHAAEDSVSSYRGV
jgi:hypothetical protein